MVKEMWLIETARIGRIGDWQLLPPSRFD